MTAGSASVAAALLLGASAWGGVATPALIRSRNPTGQWVTAAAVQTTILSLAGGHRLVVGVPPNQRAVVKVVSATVAGVPPSKLINSAQHFQLFEVRVCTIYYFRGAHRFHVHFRWFTRRPPGGTITTRTRDGRIAVVRDSGEPYGRDWNHPLEGPQAHGHC
jgi:hypothetical protein